MKATGITSTCALAMLLAIAAPAWTQEQHEQEQKEQPARQEENKAQPEKSAREEQKPAATKQEKNAKPEEKNAQQRPEEKNTKPAMKAEAGKHEQVGGKGRIPDDRFKANFGEQHKFRVSQAQYASGRHFQYGGYTFGFAAPWPSNWLYTQDVYVVEINGLYYLCNPSYPGVNVALSVVI
jgi:flagellum-specific peptidoglycan hydrolase FlgJ